jgi:diguanylate cyclase (GGDEF)-like protein
LVASGASLGNSLSEVARPRERPRSSLRCAVLLADDKADGAAHVSVGAAPSFPDEAEALVRGLDVTAFALPGTVRDGDTACAVDELPPGPLAERLRTLGAVTVGMIPLTSVQTGRQAGLLLTLDLDADPKPLRESEIDEACAALAAVAIERASTVAALTHQATHDPLTGVANRSALLDRLEVALLRARTHHGLVAVLFCDLDRFKEINDLFGHATGDEVLREVTRRISGAVQPTDTLARFGGDEFVVLIEDLRDEDEVLAVADRVAKAVAEPSMVVQGTPLQLTVSIGVAISAGGMDHPEALVRDADVAMYGAKSGGRARLEVFRAGIRRAARDRDQLARDLARAIEVGELAVHYQPLLGLEDGLVRGVEALLRWHHRERGAISPEVFIPIAEETGLIVPLGRWVADQAIEQLHVLSGLRSDWAGLRMHVNVSARQLSERGFVDELRRSLDLRDVPAKHVAVEITETVLMADSPVTAAAIGDLVEMGVELVLDDFGTGYASLTYLRRFPVRGLKIDRSFVSGLGQRAEDDAVVRAVVDLARSLDLDLVAEGVETGAQLDVLREVRCQAAQGYFFSPAVPADELPAVLERLSSRFA